MRYRPEIDGLRAIAVVPVILFHAGYESFGGGFVGVDVFFVISGYLITSILIEDIAQNRFSIVHFYERRARRILPALFLVMLVCIPFAWAWMLPSQLTAFADSLAAVSFFGSNVLFARQSGYFATAAEEKPLLHTWSLAVEEQYYLLFPLLLVFIWRFGKNRAFWIIAALAMLSLMKAEWGSRAQPKDTFFLADTRAWELLAGSLTAFVLQGRQPWSRNGPALLGFIAVIFAILVYDDTTPFPGLYTVLPVAGVVLLILFADTRTWVGAFLANRALVGIGLISYSAYLWHQPLFAFARIKSIQPPGPMLMAVLAGGSIALAYLSWRLVEQPFRRKGGFGRRSVFAAAGFGMVFFLIVGLAGHGLEGPLNQFRYRNDPGVQRSHEALTLARAQSPVYIDKNRYDDGECRFSVTDISAEVAERLLKCERTYGSGILVFGDSHATNLYHSLVSIPVNDSRPFLVGLTKNGCHLPADRRACPYGDLLSFVADHPDLFSDVIYEKAAYLMLYHGGERSNLRRASSAIEIGTKQKIIQGVGDYLDRLAADVPVTWFGPRIEPTIDEAEYFAAGCDGPFSISHAQQGIFERLDRALQEFSIGRNWRYLSQLDAYRFDFPADFGGCDGLLWIDSNHFSSDGEREFGSRFNLLQHLD